MKRTAWLLTFAILPLSTAIFAQDSRPLDGKSFKVKTWDTTESNLKTPESLVFRNGHVDAPVCHEYGFFASPYKAEVRDDGVHFTFVSESESEGTLHFDGVVKAEEISGTYTWKKAGRADLSYAFEGTLDEL